MVDRRRLFRTGFGLRPGPIEKTATLEQLSKAPVPVAPATSL